MDGHLSQHLPGKMLLSPRVLKSLNNIKKIQPRMTVAIFNGNPSTTIISCYNSTNASNETDLSSPSTMRYPPLSVVSPNTTFKSSVEKRMLK